MRFRPFFYLLFAAASACAQTPDYAVEQIEACLSELARNKSIHIVDGQLAKTWSVARVTNCSDTDLTFVSFGGPVKEDKPDPNVLNHDWAIVCTVKNSSNVVSLISPELDGGLVTFVEDIEGAEDRAYEQIVENLRVGKTVDLLESVFRISDANIVQIEETEKSQVNPSDFGVN